MKLFHRIAFLLVVMNVSIHAATTMEVVPPENIDYYRQTFPEAVFQTVHAIPDGITEGDINATYLMLFDQQQQHLGYIREVNTSTGCISFCKPLDFTLAFNLSGSFRTLLSREPLTKLGHREFTAADYAKLYSILGTPPASYATASEPMDLVDAVTLATKPAFKSDVVRTAALTSFRTYQYTRQTTGHLTSASGSGATTENVNTP